MTSKHETCTTIWCSIVVLLTSSSILCAHHFSPPFVCFTSTINDQKFRSLSLARDSSSGRHKRTVVSHRRRRRGHRLWKVITSNLRGLLCGGSRTFWLNHTSTPLIVPDRDSEQSFPLKYSRYKLHVNVRACVCRICLPARWVHVVFPKDLVQGGLCATAAATSVPQLATASCLLSPTLVPEYTSGGHVRDRTWCKYIYIFVYTSTVTAFSPGGSEVSLEQSRRTMYRLVGTNSRLTYTGRMCISVCTRHVIRGCKLLGYVFARPLNFLRRLFAVRLLAHAILNTPVPSFRKSSLL